MKPNILILGTGFASISCLQALKKAMRANLVDVTLVSEENYIVFQPMLPEVVSGSVEPSHVISSVRSMSNLMRFYRASVKEIDLNKKQVNIVGNDIKKERMLDFDHLVVGLGLSNDFSRVPGLAEHSHAFKNLGDAFFLRNEVINKLEEAVLETDPEIQKELLSFVIIGGGFSGVETAGQLNDLLKKTLKQYPNLDPNLVQVFLIHSRERILKELSASLGLYAQKKLEERGVQIILNTYVKTVFENKILLTKGDEIVTRTVINTTGNAPNLVLANLECINDKGRLDTNAYLQVLQAKDSQDASQKAYGHLWAIGDCAFIPDTCSKTPKLCPPTAQYATRQGKACAKNILRYIQKKPLTAFKFKLIGQLAVIGHLVGVAEILNVRFSGFFAFILWRAIYWSKLPGIVTKYRIAMDWAASLFFPPDSSQINVFQTACVSASHYPKDSFICKQGDTPDYFYIIKQGKVSVLRTAHHQTKQVAVLAEGDSFGEMGLLEKIPRQASVKCLSTVEVLKVKPEDFHSIIGTHSTFRHQMEAKVEGIIQQNKKP